VSLYRVTSKFGASVAKACECCCSLEGVYSCFAYVQPPRKV
jgi:hypothetical protein